MPRVQSPEEKHTSKTAIFKRDPCEFEHGHMHPDVPEEPSAAVGTERGDLVGDLNCGNVYEVNQFWDESCPESSDVLACLGCRVRWKNTPAKLSTGLCTRGMRVHLMIQGMIRPRIG
jgi:hypothetical protein